MAKAPIHKELDFVRWFRDSSGYINAFRGKTFVIAFGGEMLTDAQFAPMVHDIALLNSLGIKLVLVHGARPQIEQRLRDRHADFQYVNGLRLTDAIALDCVKEACSSVRADIEALLSTGLHNQPGNASSISVVSGNFVTAQPLGVRNGVDYQHTGEVRKIDQHAICQQLELNNIVLLSPMGYSPTGEIFNLSAEDVATTAAMQLNADKLIFMVDGKGITNRRKQLVRELTLEQARELLGKNPQLAENLQRTMENAIRACDNSAIRVHILDRHLDGVLLLELFTRDGSGTLIMHNPFEDIRAANIDDIAGLIDLITPLEEDDILVRRSREKLEMEIDHFTVVERDGKIIACAAIYPSIRDKVAELACLAVHPDYRKQGRADALLSFVEKQAKQLGTKRLFVLTTRTAHWFRERGFVAADLKKLPVKRQQLYNYKRQSKIFIKDL